MKLYKACPLDPIQTIFLTITPTSTQLTGASLPSGTFSSVFKVARVTQLLQKLSLDPTHGKLSAGLAPPISVWIKWKVRSLTVHRIPNHCGFKSGLSTEPAHVWDRHLKKSWSSCSVLFSFCWTLPRLRQSTIQLYNAALRSKQAPYLFLPLKLQKKLVC